MVDRIKTEDVEAVARAIEIERATIERDIPANQRGQVVADSHALARAALASPPIERLREENVRVRGETIDEAAETARGWIIWVLKGQEGRERVADSVSKRILSLKARATLTPSVDETSG